MDEKDVSKVFVSVQQYIFISFMDDSKKLIHNPAICICSQYIIYILINGPLLCYTSLVYKKTIQDLHSLAIIFQLDIVH